MNIKIIGIYPLMLPSSVQIGKKRNCFAY